MAGRLQAKLARGGAVEKPGLEPAVLDHRQRASGDAFGIERARAQTASPQRIIDDADPAGEQLLAQLVLEEARLARDGAAVDRAGEMTDQPAGDAGIEHDRDLPGRDLARL